MLGGLLLKAGWFDQHSNWILGGWHWKTEFVAEQFYRVAAILKHLSNEQPEITIENVAIAPF